jgi:hypothetical protein
MNYFCVSVQFSSNRRQRFLVTLEIGKGPSGSVRGLKLPAAGSNTMQIFCVAGYIFPDVSKNPSVFIFRLQQVKSLDCALSTVDILSPQLGRKG